VDHQLAKNLVGSFYQPALVCIDPAMLASLPDAQVRNGVAEIIKYGMIADEGLFMLLERQMKSLPRLEPGLLEEVIRRCCQIKARIVQQDVRETTGLRMILNYGHTIGHAVEAVTGYTRFSHGEAIAIGMTAAAKIARIMDLATEEVETRQRELLSGAGLPIALTGIETAQLIEATLLDKKATGGRPRFVIPLAVGKVVVKEGIPVELVEQALHELKAR
jgi:3-dehydroquinate synthase